MPETILPLRDRILEASRQFLIEDGLRALSMRRIAKRIGISATSIYIYFENKDHLVHTLMEESLEQLAARIEESAAGETNPVRKFRSIINAYIDFAFQNPENYQIIYLVQPGTMAPFPQDKFRKSRRSFELLVGVIEEGVKEGSMQADAPLIAAYSIWAQLHGVVSVVLTQRLDKRINQDEFIREATEQIIQGVMGKTSISYGD